MRKLEDGYFIDAPTQDEISALIQIDRAASALFEPTGLLTGNAHFEYVPADVLSEAMQHGHVFVVRDANSQPVGFTLTSYRGSGLYLDQISVHPDHGRKGIGRVLMLKVLENAEDRHLPDVSLSTFRDIPWNGPFYASMGFREISRDKLEPYMIEIENSQRELMDVSKRCFMRRKVRRPLLRFNRSA